MQDGSHATEVEKTWEAYWAKRATLDERLLRRWLRAGLGFAGTELCLRTAERAVGSFAGQSILDAGAGGGLSAIALARRGGQLTLLDTSSSALAVAEKRLAACGLQAPLVEGTIFELPFPDRSFDFAWNTGVVEHFRAEDRRRALAEMLRVSRRAAVTVNPYAGARTYRRLHARAVNSGRWDVGYEDAIETLSGSVGAGVELTEVAVGRIAELVFLKYVLPGPLRVPLVAAVELAERALPAIDRRPGYFLVSVLRRRDPGP